MRDDIEQNSSTGTGLVLFPALLREAIFATVEFSHVLARDTLGTEVSIRVWKFERWLTENVQPSVLVQEDAQHFWGQRIRRFEVEKLLPVIVCHLH